MTYERMLNLGFIFPAKKNAKVIPKISIDISIKKVELSLFK